jgi:4-hydroxysphinganine ceramide fatty acyl 2-hydroxylase
MAAVESCSSASSCCLLTIEGSVYDVGPFLSHHPGGRDVILAMNGKDATAAFTTAAGHVHSKFARRLLQKYYIGPATPPEHKESAATVDIENAEKGLKPDTVSSKLDFTQGILWQLPKLTWNEYEELISTPLDPKIRLRLFKSDFFEFFTSTYWWMIPILWIPFILTNFSLALQYELPIWYAVCILLLGLFTWTIVEYTLHRWLFHFEEHIKINHPIAIVSHFLLHGCHHIIPMDSGRLVMPPVLSFSIALGIASILFSVLPMACAFAYGAGLALGYLFYDLTHYYLHHAVPTNEYFKQMKTYHLDHHYKNHYVGFGITSKFWDYIFGTMGG